MGAGLAFIETETEESENNNCLWWVQGGFSHANVEQAVWSKYGIKKSVCYKKNNQQQGDVMRPGMKQRYCS